jgi:hypothetical protein
MSDFVITKWFWLPAMIDPNGSRWSLRAREEICMSRSLGSLWVLVLCLFTSGHSIGYLSGWLSESLTLPSDISLRVRQRWLRMPVLKSSGVCTVSQWLPVVVVLQAYSYLLLDRVSRRSYIFYVGCCGSTCPCWYPYFIHSGSGSSRENRTQIVTIRFYVVGNIGGEVN